MLVMLPFLCSMLIINDVALLTFVPFTILILDHDRRKRSIWPGSWCSRLWRQTWEHGHPVVETCVGTLPVMVVFPYRQAASSRSQQVSTVRGAPALTAAVFAFPGSPCRSSGLTSSAAFPEKNAHPALFVLFLLCLLSVFRVADYRIVLACHRRLSPALHDRKLFSHRGLPFTAPHLRLLLPVRRQHGAARLVKALYGREF